MVIIGSEIFEDGADALAGRPSTEMKNHRNAAALANARARIADDKAKAASLQGGSDAETKDAENRLKRAEAMAWRAKPLEAEAKAILVIRTKATEEAERAAAAAAAESRKAEQAAARAAEKAKASSSGSKDKSKDGDK